jgi:anti-sigma factor RsiW
VSQSITHSRAFELLPWLVNGSLGAEERDLVEQHVRSCLACHRELKEQQRLRAALRAQPVVHLSPQTNFDKLAHALDGQLVQSAPPTRRFTQLVRFAAAAAVAATAVGAVLWLSPTHFDTQGDYRTLASGSEAPRGELDIVFGQSVTQAEMQSVLEQIGAKIDAGPSSVGRYRVRLERPVATDAELDALVAKLGKDPRVRFAARALTEEAGP